jgi:hypothetical protein
MIILKLYTIFAIIWALYAVYKVSQMGHLGKQFRNKLITFIVNLILFPYTLFYSIVNKKN